MDLQTVINSVWVETAARARALLPVWDTWCADDGRVAALLSTATAYALAPTPARYTAFQQAHHAADGSRRMVHTAAWGESGEGLARHDPPNRALDYAMAVYWLSEYLSRDSFYYQHPAAIEGAQNYLTQAAISTGEGA